MGKELSMKDCRQFYIDGKWVAPSAPKDFDVVNPATEEKIATISLGSSVDVDKAVAAASKAFESFGESTVAARLAILQKIADVYQARMDEIAETISEEMGAPIWLAKGAQAPAGFAHLAEIIKVLGYFSFEH